MNKNNFIINSTLLASFIFLNFAYIKTVNKQQRRVKLYNEILLIYQGLLNNTIPEIAEVQKTVTRYKRSSEEEKLECKEILIFFLQSLACNSQICEADQILVANWLRDIIIIPLPVDPSSYSKKVYPTSRKAFNLTTFRNEETKTIYLVQITKIIDQKDQATPQDLENLIYALKFLRLLCDQTELFNEKEKIQILILLAQLDKKALNFENLPETEKLNVIYGLLYKTATDTSLRETVLEFVKQIVVDAINKMKGDKEVPYYLNTLKILLSWNIINQLVFVDNKTQIEQWLTDLKIIEEAITKLRTTPPSRFLSKRPSPGSNPKRRNPLKSGRPSAIRQLVRPAHKV